MNQIICEVGAINARLDNLSSKLNTMQQQNTSLRSEIRERNSGNVVVVDNQERSMHVKISNAQQFAEMEEKLKAPGNAELCCQLVSLLGIESK